MGNLSDSVRTLVDEITAATHNRRHHLQGLAQETRQARQEWRSELQEVRRSLGDHFAATRVQRATATRVQRDVTREFMDESHRAHQERARAFGDSFAANTRARREVSHQLMDEIHRAHEQCRVTVSELRSDAHNTTERFGLERQDMAKVVQERLSSAGQALRDAVQEVRDAAQAMVGELVADRRQAHQHWTEGFKKKLAPEAVATEAVVPPAAVVEEVAAAVEAPSEVETARPLPLEERVLEVIARRPQGIRLVDIGNELGVDWRSLLGVSRTIMEEDKVERIDNLYYPKGGGPQAAGEEA